MSDTNIVIIEGRITRNAESKIAGTTTVVNFSIANNLSFKQNGEYKDSVSYFECELWGKYAESMFKYLTKGRKLTVTGRLVQQTWQDTAGKTHSRVKVRVSDMSVVFDKKSSGVSVPAEEEMPPAEDNPFGDASTF